MEWQSARYVDGLPEALEPAVEGGLAFVFESTGAETRFTNRLDPDPASRPVFSFHRPEALGGWLEEMRRHPTAPTLRHRLRTLPELNPGRQDPPRSQPLPQTLPRPHPLPAPREPATDDLTNIEASLAQTTVVGSALHSAPLVGKGRPRARPTGKSEGLAQAACQS